MRTRKAYIPLLMAILAACAAGCSAAAVLKNQCEQTQKTVQQAKELGSVRCMPKETALAETRARFAMDEYKEGNYSESESNLKLALENANAALEFAKANPDKCLPPKVVVAPAPKMIDLCKIDSDGDGVMNCEDECPSDPGVAQFKGCQPPDRDRDGIPDPEDACPDIPGLPVYKGCPDSDGDGIPDNLDRCPRFPGPPGMAGCPDTDGDGIPDVEDRCPYEPGAANKEDPSRHGCRPYTLVVVKKGIIEIKEQVHFETGKAIIKADSYELLQQVAQVMKDNPAFVIEVQGHTDNVGGKKTNKKLSDARAKSVREFMIKREGIDEARLKAAGYGMERPIASNSTTKGRALNRRVEFRIIAGQGDSGAAPAVPLLAPPEPGKPGR